MLWFISNVSKSLIMALCFFSYSAFYSSIIMYRERQIIISILRIEGVNEKIWGVWSSLGERVPACAVSWSLVLRFLSFLSSTWTRRRRRKRFQFCIFANISHYIQFNFTNLWQEFSFGVFITYIPLDMKWSA